jgi:glycosyltransferase involved in cell wall biosynthesis
LVSFSRSDRAARIAHQIEATAVKDATAVVAVTDAARDEIRRRYPDESEHKFRVVPNGFDASMLGASEPITRPRSDDRVVVTYIGSVYGSTEPTTLVEALLALPSEVKSRLQIRFIGHIEEPRYRDSLLRLGDMVELNGFLPQRAALAAMKDSDYALLVSHDPLNVSAKFYDYVGAHKPILATIHSRGDVRAKLDELRAGWWADSRDVKGICRLFIDAVNRIDTLASEFRPELEKVAGYERGVLAHRYADLLREIAHWHNGVSPELPRVELAGGSCEL